MALECLIGDRRTAQFKSWDKWMQAVDGLRCKWGSDLDDDPLRYNEVAAMSLLAMAAAKINWFALSEYTTVKQGKSDRRRNANGRADLWVYDHENDISWSIEAKYGWLNSTKGKKGQAKRIEDAISDARCIKSWEARHIIAIVVTLHSLGDGDIELNDVTCMNPDGGGARKPDYCWKMSLKGTETEWEHDAYLSLYNVK